MFTRALPRPERSFFLFGPRATGKTTWLRQELPDAQWFDLLLNDVFLRYLQDPARFRHEVEALPARSWIVVDEVQKLPALLDEVQALVANRGRGYRFALSGSSARKLKRLDANLLAGRVINRAFFPLTLAELGATGERAAVDGILRHGLLPGVWDDPNYALDTLEAYAANYLREEIQQEALTKNLASFTRFLRVAASLNGQIVNVTNIASESAVPRVTVQRYFDVLVDTLIGVFVPAWQPRLKVRETAHPKFYFFDCGVARAAAGRTRAALDDLERGRLLETWLLHELRANLQLTGAGGELSYYRTGAGVEVDFIWTGPSYSVAVEIKSATRWKPGFGIALRELVERKVVKRAIGVYLGDAPLLDGRIRVLPVKQFVRELPKLMA